MNRKLLTSAVVIHAGACLVAFIAVGAGASTDHAKTEPVLSDSDVLELSIQSRSAPEVQWEPVLDEVEEQSVEAVISY